jgi:hypothetical protein
MFFLGDWGQQMDVEEMRGELQRLRRERRRLPPEASAGARLEERVATLQRENDEIRLYLAAVIRHLLSKKLLLPTELEALVALIDGEDDAEDGAYRGPLA